MPGSHCSAGEIGFLLPDCSQVRVRREGYGALESLASGTSIAIRAREEMSGKLTDEELGAISAEHVFDAYRRDEDWAITIIRDMIEYLSQMIVTLAVCFDPDLIVLSGGVAKSADVFIDPILEQIEGVIPVTPKLVDSKLGHRAAIMGVIVEILYNTADFYIVRKWA